MKILRYKHGGDPILTEEELLHMGDWLQSFNDLDLVGSQLQIFQVRCMWQIFNVAYPIADEEELFQVNEGI